MSKQTGAEGPLRIFSRAGVVRDKKAGGRKGPATWNYLGGSRWGSECKLLFLSIFTDLLGCICSDAINATSKKARPR